MLPKRQNPVKKGVPKVKVLKKKNPLSYKSGLTLTNKRSTISFTNSVDANRSDVGSNDTLNTLNMISTPWSTESGFTSSEAFSSWTTMKTHLSSSSVDPLTTTASSHLPSPNFSKATITLYLAPTPSDSILLGLPLVKKSSLETLSSWTMETFTSKGLISENSQEERKRHPWGPVSIGTDCYPSSTDTLASRKGSRISVKPASSDTKENYFPINYIKHITLNPNTHIGLDWNFAKEYGIPVVISVPI